MIVSFRDVDIYQHDRKVVSDVTFDIDRGELVYVLGKTGSGKSSVLKAMYAELPVDYGYAEVCGYDLTKITDNNIPFLRRKLGVVFQDFQLLTDLNVYKNLEFVLNAVGKNNKEVNRRKIEEMMHRVGLEGLEKVNPFQLSGGEQQRVVIARALINDPELIIADEPTGNLDPDTSLEILDLFKEIVAEGTSVIMATHDLTVIQAHPSITYRVENHQWMAV